MSPSLKIAAVILTLIFTIGLTAASVEIPHLASRVLMDHLDTPGFDSGHHPAETEAFIGAHHLRAVGIVGLIMTGVLIVVGMIAERRGMAAAGALLFFLPVFGHFATSMFFLAGLAILRVGWLPFLDISHEIMALGDVVYLPYAAVVYPLVNLGLDIRDLLPWPVMALGIAIFVASTLAWMLTKFARRDVARSWLYRYSRHPQYLGWIIWSYGLLLYVLRHSELYRFKITWGMPSSLPWLVSSLVIVGVAMLEELRMTAANRDAYVSFRESTPFLIPLPSWLNRAIAAPMRWVLRRPWPETGTEVAVAVGVYAVILIGASIPLVVFDWPPRIGWWGFPYNVWPLAG